MQRWTQRLSFSRVYSPLVVWACRALPSAPWICTASQRPNVIVPGNTLGSCYLPYFQSVMNKDKRPLASLVFSFLQNVQQTSSLQRPAVIPFCRKRKVSGVLPQAIPKIPSGNPISTADESQYALPRPPGLIRPLTTTSQLSGLCLPRLDTSISTAHTPCLYRPPAGRPRPGQHIENKE